MESDRKVLLLIEARQADANLILRMLREADHHRAFVVEVVETLADGIRHAQEADVAIIDLSLPDSKGLDTFRALRNVANVPIIVIINEEDERIGIQAVKEGAQDFLVFGQFISKVLHRSILYSIERHRREVAEDRLDSVLTALTEMRNQVKGLTTEVRGCRNAVNNLSSQDARSEIEMCVGNGTGQ